MDEVVKNLLCKCVNVVMDSLEACVDSVALAPGKRLLKAFCVCCFFFVLSVTLGLFGMYCFISWEEALTAAIISGVVCLFDGSNRETVKGFKKKLRGGSTDGK